MNIRKGGAMPRTLLAVLFALVPGLAFASPPAAGSIHTFVDPMFGQTVVCDTVQQVQTIVVSRQPEAKFREFYGIPNAKNEPTCDALTPTGVVMDVTPLGRMMKDGKSFYAYAVQSDADGITFYALYLEYEDIVHA
jgi:hypothetical protein